MKSNQVGIEQKNAKIKYIKFSFALLRTLNSRIEKTQTITKLVGTTNSNIQRKSSERITKYDTDNTTRRRWIE